MLELLFKTKKQKKTKTLLKYNNNQQLCSSLKYTKQLTQTN
jgi:hypothetical protein